jgi:hypothetical protein
MRPTRFSRAAVPIAAVAALGLLIYFYRPISRTRGTLDQQAYVWQRSWTGDVRLALTQSSRQFSNVICLAAEITWNGVAPEIVRVPLDLQLAGKLPTHIGLSIRIGSYRGAFRPNDDAALAIQRVAADLLSDARDAGVQVSELQLDFDAADSQLQGYKIWVESLRRSIAPVPLTITALPTWLNERAFSTLAHACDGFVLQVHSFRRPRGIAEPYRLCDPDDAKDAVEAAARVGVPFRVALPTYAYVLAFDAEGQFIGLSAEGPSPLWPAEARLREVSADPNAMARLVRDWTGDRPTMLKGIIWYRLPVESDRRNWRMVTLRAVMTGREPQPTLRATVTHPQPGLAEVQLKNIGDGDAPADTSVTLTWDDAQLIAADGLGGFRRSASETGALTLTLPRGSARPRLAPGDSRLVGWVRLSADTKVHANVSLETK